MIIDIYIDGYNHFQCDTWCSCVMKLGLSGVDAPVSPSVSTASTATTKLAIASAHTSKINTKGSALIRAHIQ